MTFPRGFPPKPRLVTFLVGQEGQRYVLKESTCVKISRYFYTILTNNGTIESQTRTIVWDDIDVQTFRYFLKFVHFGDEWFRPINLNFTSPGTFPWDKDDYIMSMAKVIVLADRYDIKGLADHCITEVKKSCFHFFIYSSIKTVEESLEVIHYLWKNTMPNHEIKKVLSRLLLNFESRIDETISMPEWYDKRPTSTEAERQRKKKIRVITEAYKDIMASIDGQGSYDIAEYLQNLHTAAVEL